LVATTAAATGKCREQPPQLQEIGSSIPAVSYFPYHVFHQPQQGLNVMVVSLYGMKSGRSQRVAIRVQRCVAGMSSDMHMLQKNKLLQYSSAACLLLLLTASDDSEPWTI
jgi:hypothetical protein